MRFLKFVTLDLASKNSFEYQVQQTQSFEFISHSELFRFKVLACSHVWGLGFIVELLPSPQQTQTCTVVELIPKANESERRTTLYEVLETMY